MSTTPQTEALYTALERAIGEEPTETLMDLLSRDEDTATRADLALLRSELTDEFQKIHAKFEQIDGKFEQGDARLQQVDARFEKIDARFEDLNSTFHSYARMFIVVHTTTVLAVAGMVLGVTQLM